MDEADTAERAAAPATSQVLERLWATIEARRGADAGASYSASLLARHPAKAAQKLAEEAAECAIEAVRGDRAALVRESADLLYHLVVLLVGAGIGPDALFGVLEARERSSALRLRSRKALRSASGGTTKIP